MSLTRSWVLKPTRPRKVALQTGKTIELAFIVTLTLLLLLRLPLKSHAFEEWLPAEAEQALRDGLDATKGEKWDEAIRHFTEAHKKARFAYTPLYSLALAHAKASHELAAAIWFRAYLAARPSGSNESIQTQMKQLRATTLAKVDRLINAGFDAVLKVSPGLGFERPQAWGQLQALLCVSGDPAWVAQMMSRVPSQERRKEMEVFANCGDFLAGVADIRGGINLIGAMTDSRDKETAWANFLEKYDSRMPVRKPSSRPVADAARQQCPTWGSINSASCQSFIGRETSRVKLKVEDWKAATLAWIDLEEYLTQQHYLGAGSPLTVETVLERYVRDAKEREGLYSNRFAAAAVSLRFGLSWIDSYDRELSKSSITRLPLASPTMEVRSATDRVRLFLDDHSVGEVGPDRVVVVRDIAVGTHRLRARKEGYQEFTRDVPVYTNILATVVIDLDKQRQESVVPRRQVATPFRGSCKPLSGPWSTASRAEVQSILRDAYQLARGADPKERDDLLLEIARLATTIMDFQFAKQVGAERSKPDQDSLLSAMALAATAACDISGSLQTIGEIVSSTTKAGTLAQIGVAWRATDRAEADRLMEQARQFAASLQTSAQRESALWNVATAQAQARDFDAARETIRMKSDVKARAHAFVHLARIQRASNDAAGSVDTLRRALSESEVIPDQKERTYILLPVAEGFFEAGDRQRASLIYETLSSLAPTIPDVDRYGDTRSFVLGQVAQFRAERMNDYAAAIKIARTLDGRTRVGTLAAIGRAQWRGGDRTGAAATFREATEAAQDMEDGPWVVGSAQAAAGDLAGALRAAAQLKVSFQKASLLADIASAQVSSGDRVAATATLKEAASLQWNWFAVMGAATALDFGLAVDIWQTIPPTAWEKSSWPSSMTRAATKAGHAREAMAWANGLIPERTKAGALIGIAEGLIDRIQESTKGTPPKTTAPNTAKPKRQ